MASLLDRPAPAPAARPAFLVYLAALGVLLLGAGLGWALRDLTTDDPFITYRYARNLARGLGPVYNPGEPVLATTAPLFAALLALAARLGLDVPTTARVLGALSITSAGLVLLAWGSRAGRPLAGSVAALFYAACPLLWLTLGFETPLLLLLGLAACFALVAGRPGLAGLLAGLATAGRGDGAILALALGIGALIAPLDGRQQSVTGAPAADRRPTIAAKVSLRHLFLRLARPRSSALFRLTAACLAVVVPWIAALTALYGSPLPATLAAKSSQARLGLTGFYPGTTFPEGAWLLAQAFFAQTPLLALALPLAALGLAAGRWSGWTALLLVWAALYALGYTLLGVAPYPWYYAPLAPALLALAGAGVAALTPPSSPLSRAGDRAVDGRGGFATRPASPGSARTLPRMLARALPALAALLFLALLLGELLADAAIARVVAGGPVPPPEQVAAKALPEAKVDLYRQVGVWLRESTPPDARIGVLEVGVIGSYADRPMVDFLGLLQPEIARALGRGDVFWSVQEYQPEFLLLGSVNPFYSYYPLTDPWFLAAYQPIREFHDERFWAGPLRVYQRTSPVRPLRREPVAAEAAPGLRLVGVGVEQGTLEPDRPYRLELQWQRGPDAPAELSIVARLVREDGLLGGQRELPYRPRDWPVGQTVPVYHAFAVEPNAPPGAYHLEVLVHRSTGPLAPVLRLPARAKLPPPPARAPAGPPLARFGDDLALLGADLPQRVGPDRRLPVVLTWRAERASAADLLVRLRLLDPAGREALAYANGPRGRTYPSYVWESGEVVEDGHLLLVPDDLPPGRYQVLLRAEDARTGEAMGPGEIELGAVEVD